MATALHDRPDWAELSIVAEALIEDSCFPQVRIPSLADAVQQFFRDPSVESRLRLNATVTELRAARRANALARWRGILGNGAA